jgi:lipopolysaccharide transport system permease protein
MSPGSGELHPPVFIRAYSWLAHLRWTYLRDLLRELVSRDIRLRYKGSILGQAWTLLNPLTELLVLMFVFQTVLSIGIPNYAPFLFTGILVYGWFQSALYYATVAIVGNRELIRRPGVPSTILPVVTVASTLVHFLLSLPVLFVLLITSGVAITGAVLALPVMIAIEFLLILCLAYPLATAHVWFRDTQYLLRLALQLLFYLTPIFYQASSIPDRYKWLYYLNPMVLVVEGYRDVLLRGRLPALMPLLVLTVCSMVALLAGVSIFRSTSHRFGDRL